MFRPTAIVLHDSVTRSTASTLRVLKGKRLSTHFCVDEAGTVTPMQPTTQAGAHAGSAWNCKSIGVDAVNLYDPACLDKADRWGDADRRGRIIHRPWSPKRGVIAMTEVQTAGLVALVERLCSEHGIPRRVLAGGLHQTVDAGTFRGIIAHGQFCASRWDGMLCVEALRAAGFEEVAA